MSPVHFKYHVTNNLTSHEFT